MDFKNRKFELFGTTWTIKYVKGLIDLGDGEGSVALGATNNHDHIIEVSIIDENGKPFPEPEIKLTLYHELMHAIFYTGQYLNCTSDEPLVEWCARCINQCIKKGII